MGSNVDVGVGVEVAMGVRVRAGTGVAVTAAVGISVGVGRVVGSAAGAATVVTGCGTGVAPSPFVSFVAVAAVGSEASPPHDSINNAAARQATVKRVFPTVL